MKKGFPISGVLTWGGFFLVLAHHSQAVAFSFCDLVSSPQPVITQIHLSTFEQLLVVLAGFVMKPTYMVLSSILIIILWRQKEFYFKWINYALISFLAGELFCAATYMLVGGDCDLLEALHGLGMVGFSIGLPWGMLVMMDKEVLHFLSTDKACRLMPLCRHCAKNHPGTCNLNRLFRFTTVALALLALFPLAVPLKPFHIRMEVFNGFAQFKYSTMILMLETRIYPFIGGFLMLICALRLNDRIERTRQCLPLFFTGLGFILYANFRFILVYAFFHLPQWMNFWEELTELLTIVGLGYFLYLIRDQLVFIKGSRRNNFTL